MATIKFALEIAGFMAVALAFAQTAGGVQSTGSQDAENVGGGRREGNGDFVAGELKDASK
jgi:hypothetical protein